MKPGNRRAILAALFANLGLAVAKLVGWLVTGASSMLAEAGHSLADTTNQGLLLWGGSAAARRPSRSHPFGHGRERYFWAFVVAVVIFLLGGVFALYEGVSKLISPHPVAYPFVAIAILTFGLVVEGFSFRTAIGEARLQKGQRTWWAYIRGTKEPELPVVLLEDFGAMLGLVFALIGVSLAMATGNGAWDAVGSAAIGVLLIAIAVVLTIEMKSLLIGEAAAPDDLEQIVVAMNSVSTVRQMIHMRTQHLGPDELLVAAKIEFEQTLGFEDVSAAIDEVEDAIRESVPIARIIYIEPALYQASRHRERSSVEE